MMLQVLRHLASWGIDYLDRFSPIPESKLSVLRVNSGLHPCYSRLCSGGETVKHSTATFLLLVTTATYGASFGTAQGNPVASGPAPNLRINSRAVLVDVLVTDHKGAPVTGLNREAFTVTEQSKPQSVTFFEEHTGAQQAEAGRHAEFPALPQDIFSNFTPFPAPPAVNILLLDALNTSAGDQQYLRKNALKYLKSLKPGSRLAIFTLSTRLRFVQGFSDDPTALVAALERGKNGATEVPALLQSAGEANSQAAAIGLGSQAQVSPAMTGALQDFMAEGNAAQYADRAYRTLEALHDLAEFLGAFPGRKNLVWLAGSFPVDDSGITGVPFADTNGRFDGQIRDAYAALAAARVAIYPVDVQGVLASEFFTAESGAGIGGGAGLGSGAGAALTRESIVRNSEYLTMDTLAEKTGGHAFYSSNRLSEVIDKIVSSSANFYTLSYTPTNTKMDGGYRNISVKVAGEGYRLSYRRGYFAVDQNPSAVAKQANGKKANDRVADANRAQGQAQTQAPDPLQPFMQPGMPQADRILYKILVQPSPAGAGAPQKAPQPMTVAESAGARHYAVDFAIDLDDLELSKDADGIHRGTLNVSLLVFDHYGQVASEQSQLITLHADQEMFAVYQKAGVQLHFEIDVPKGDYWLRTGVLDHATRKVGTMEVPLGAVKPMVAAAE
jgi:VWFA-related protein